MCRTGRFVTQQIPFGPGLFPQSIVFPLSLPHRQRYRAVGVVRTNGFHNVRQARSGKEPVFPALQYKGAKAQCIPLPGNKQEFLLLSAGTAGLFRSRCAARNNSNCTGNSWKIRSAHGCIHLFRKSAPSPAARQQTGFLPPPFVNPAVLLIRCAIPDATECVPLSGVQSVPSYTKKCGPLPAWAENRQKPGSKNGPVILLSVWFPCFLAAQVSPLPSELRKCRFVFPVGKILPVTCSFIPACFLFVKAQKGRRITPPSPDYSNKVTISAYSPGRDFTPIQQVSFEKS